jgi:hypothetical protein
LVGQEIYKASCRREKGSQTVQKVENEPGVEKMKEKSKVLEEKMHEPSHHVPLRFVE